MSPAPSVVGGSGLATRYAPSFALIASHFAVGIAGLCAFSVALVLRASQLDGHFFQPTLLGLTHLCVLGWLLPIALGALHQLVPVVFEVPVRSERVAWAALALYVVGATGLIGHLWAFRTSFGLPLSAGILCAAIWLYAIHLLATLARAPSVTLTGVYVMAALVYLLLAAALGFALAWNLAAPWLYTDHLRLLRAHAHAAGLGFFGLLVMGVAYRLLEMFLLSYGASMRAGWIALLAINLALPSLIVSFVFGPSTPVSTLGAAASVVGVAAFLWQVRAIFRARMRRKIDTAWRHTALAFTYFAVVVLLGPVLLAARLAPPWGERLALAYGILALPATMGSVVVGQLYKILPFLVWFHRFSAYVGLKKVPSASELLPEPPQRLQWAVMHLGLALLVAGVIAALPVVRLVGAVAFAASAALVARNLWVIYERKP